MADREIVCPICFSREKKQVGYDYYAADDETTYFACLSCKVLYWFNTFLGHTSTNGHQARDEYFT